ncbi:uncharacterized protein LOC123269599 [Cotesia glomerata]|uniref:Lipocalin/cytosolic fatty-acid binding domain-containing protein n=1 Tax=Cotesia glomerata TaxID=32391 RepID=A0AAV7J6B6_COTGL|nr:uncharacterized protein LOC123269599 [Cotesia glomerata]KAH0567322.1 hypothetical protein KQX54_008409 [Cotesia glomerata]
MIRTLIVFCLIVGAFAHPDYGPCPRVPTEYVDVNRMAGKWYGYARSSNNKDEAERCPIFNWIQTDDGRTLFVFSDISALINDNSTIVADVNVVSNSLFLRAHIPVLEVERKHHYIVETDYDNYEIVYECVEQGPHHISNEWVVTRSLQTNKNLDNIIQNAYRRRGLPVLPLDKVNRKICLQK